MKKILLVDDQQIILDVLEIALRKFFGYKIYSEIDPTKVIDKALQIIPDLIILDVVMPNKTGCEIATEIRECAKLSKTKVIFFSGIFSEKEAKLYNKTHKHETCLPKSSNLKALLDCIQNISDFT